MEKNSPLMEKQKADFFDIEEEEINLSEYWLVLKRHKWGILTFALVAGLIGFLYAQSQPPVYYSEVKLLAEPVAQKNVGPSDIQFVNTAWVFYETQYEIIASRTVAEAVIKKLDLTNNPTFTGANQKKLFKLPSLNPLNWIPEHWLSNAEMRAGTGSTAEVDLLAPYVGILTAGLTVTGGDDSQVIRVGYAALDPNLASNIANAVVDSYVEFGLTARLNKVKKTTDWLTQRIAELRKNLESSETRLQAYRKKEGLLNSTQKERVVSSKLAALNDQLVRVQTRRSDFEVRYQQVRQIQQRGGGYESVGSVLASASISRLKDALVAQRSRLSELSERYGAKHPKMIAAKSETRETQRALNNEIQKIIYGIKQELDVARAQETELKSVLSAQEGSILSLQSKDFQLTKLEREVETNRQIYETFLASGRMADSNLENESSNITVMDLAHPASAPFKPRKSRILLIALVLGGFLGVLIAFLKEHLDNTLKTTEDVEKKLGLPTLGTLPVINKSELKNWAPEKVVLEGVTSSFSEAVSHLRTGILFSDMDNPPKTILVTSALPSEGKTTTAINLALSFAQLGPTLLIEADLRKPRIKKVLDQAEEPLGLTDVLAGQIPMMEALIQDPDEANLKFLLAGTPPPNPLEVLSSRTFAGLLLAVKEPFKHVVIDAPPLMAVSDAMVMAQLADATLMVVKGDATSSRVVNDALKRLQSANIKPVGVALAQLDMKKMAGYYGYHYGQYYGDYHSESKS